MNSVWPAFLITLLVCVLFLKTINYLVIKNWLSNKLSRKIIHIGTGPLFVLCWLLFPENQLSRYLAALIPLMVTARFFLIGIGLLEDKATVEALSRTGDRREILKGPFYYGLFFIILTILFWKDYPIGIIALMILCGGDGLADIFGRRFGSRTLPWNRNKSLAGSLAMYFGGLLLSIVVVFIYIRFGLFKLNLLEIIPKLIFINLIATIVESAPIHDWDNITVPISVLLSGYFLF